MPQLRRSAPPRSQRGGALALAEIGAVEIRARREAHGPAAIAAFAAGKHLRSEKPLAASVAGARLMLDAACPSGHVNMVDLTYRYSPGARFIPSLIDSGEIGEVLRVRAKYLRESVTPPLAEWPAYRRGDPKR